MGDGWEPDFDIGEKVEVHCNKFEADGPEKVEKSDTNHLKKRCTLTSTFDSPYSREFRMTNINLKQYVGSELQRLETLRNKRNVKPKKL